MYCKQVKDVNSNTKYVPMPPNIDTVNMLFNENIANKEEMVQWLDKRRPKKGKGNSCVHLSWGRGPALSRFECDQKDGNLFAVLFMLDLA